MLELPSHLIAPRTFNALPIKALWQMRLVALFSSVMLLVFFALLLGAVLLLLHLQPSGFVLVLTLMVVWLGVLLLYWLLTRWQYHYTAYCLNEEGLIIRKGMLWRSETFVLRSRVQHIDVSQTPLARLFGLATLKVYTAGTKLGSIALTGLAKTDAEYIRDQLITQDADTL